MTCIKGWNVEITLEKSSVEDSNKGFDHFTTGAIDYIKVIPENNGHFENTTNLISHLLYS